MINLLQLIVDYFVCWVKAGVVSALNWVIAGMAALVQGLLALLPPMPDLPSVPDEVTHAMSVAEYWFPLGYLVTLLGVFVALWVAWFAISIPLRWIKATDE